MVGIYTLLDWKDLALALPYGAEFALRKDAASTIMGPHVLPKDRRELRTFDLAVGLRPNLPHEPSGLTSSHEMEGARPF